MDNKINLNQLKTKIYNKLGCNYVCADDLEEKLEIKIPQFDDEQERHLKEFAEKN